MEDVVFRNSRGGGAGEGGRLDVKVQKLQGIYPLSFL